LFTGRKMAFRDVTKLTWRSEETVDILFQNWT
jgi:hypothetical protein